MSIFDHVIVGNPHWGTFEWFESGEIKTIHLGAGKCSPKIDWDYDYFARYIFDGQLSEGEYMRNMTALMEPESGDYDDEIHSRIRIGRAWGREGW